MRILIVEDEEDLANAVAHGLETLGYAVDTAYDGDTGHELATLNPYDLIVLDLNLPGMDGLELLRRIRSERSTPVLVLTARTTLHDRVTGLDLGADDYLVKPFHFDELAARTRALLRRNVPTLEPVLRQGDLHHDPATGSTWLGNRRLELTRKETGVLHYLMTHAGHTVTEEELLEHVWDDTTNPLTGTVRVHIASLRRKLGEDGQHPRYLRTIPGHGYLLQAPQGTHEGEDSDAQAPR